MSRLKAGFVVALVAVVLAGFWLLSNKPLELVEALTPLAKIIIGAAAVCYCVDRVCDLKEKSAKK